MIDGLKPYTAMKDSGVPWLGEVPKAWNVLRGRHLFEIKKRVAGEIGPQVLSVTQAGLRVKDVNSGEGQVSQDYSKYQIVEPGEFVMNSMDLLTGGVGIADIAGVTSPDYRVFVIRDGGQCRDRYVLHVLRMLYANRGFYAWGQGSAQLGRWRLPRKRFNEFPFPVPSLEEQAAIVRFLDHADRRIRRYILTKQKLIKLLEEQVAARASKAMRHPACTNQRLGLVATEHIRSIAREDAETYVALGLYNRGRGIFHKRPTLGAELGDSTFSWVEPGDLVISGQFAWEGAVALASSAEDQTIVSHRYYLLRAIKDRSTTPYLWVLLRSDFGSMLLDQHSRGAAGRNRPLNLRSLLKEPVPIPPYEMQLAVDELVDATAPLRTQAARAISLCGEFRTRLIADVVTGKLDVREEAALLPDEVEQSESLDEIESEGDTDEAGADNADEVREEVGA